MPLTDPHVSQIWIQLITLIFGVILNPALDDFGFIDPSNVVFFSTNYTMYIDEDFQLEYFNHLDPMCDLSVPLIFLSSVTKPSWETKPVQTLYKHFENTL